MKKLLIVTGALIIGIVFPISIPAAIVFGWVAGGWMASDE